MIADAPQVPPALTVQAIAPGGNISSVVQESEIHGWPHRPTANEATDITNLALLTAARRAPRSSTSVLCRFGVTMSRAVCGVSHGKRGKRYRMNVSIFEDGSYLFTHKAIR